MRLLSWLLKFVAKTDIITFYLITQTIDFKTNNKINHYDMLSLRHIDGNHKLVQPYRFVIHGAIDGYSRVIVYLKASTNNRAETVLQLFRDSVQIYNVPSRVRSDYGLENIDVVDLCCKFVA